MPQLILQRTRAIQCKLHVANCKDLQHAENLQTESVLLQLRVRDCAISGSGSLNSFCMLLACSITAIESRCLSSHYFQCRFFSFCASYCALLLSLYCIYILSMIKHR